MAHIGEETRFVFARAGKLPAFLFQLPEQFRIMHRQHRLVSKCLHQSDFVGGESSNSPALDQQRAENTVGPDKGNNQRRSETRRKRRRFQGKSIGLRNFWNLHRSTMVGDLGQEAVKPGHSHLAQRIDERRVEPMSSGEIESPSLAIEAVDGAAVRRQARPRGSKSWPGHL